MATTSAPFDVSGLSHQDLKAELATLAAHLNAGTCRWLDLVGELDRRSGWAEAGLRSCAEWIAWRCALTPRSAREHVRVARSLRELPLTHASFADGELSYAKVRALTRVATAANEQELLELARACTASQLGRVVRAYRRVTVGEAREQQEAAHLSVFWNPDGSLEIHGRLAPEDGALVLRALESARDSLWRGSAEPRPARQASNAEAVVAVADAALAHEGEGRTGGERYQVVVHADEAALSHDGDGGCELEDGSALAVETTRRLSCDASVVRDGRKSRTIPPALRRALRARDGGCRFPGCENRRFVDAHHVTIGPKVARRRSETSCCSAAAIIAPCTKAATASTATAASSIPGAASSKPSHGYHAGARTTSSSTTAPSRSTARRAQPAAASAWIWRMRST
jgi:hypothetical protein